MCLFGIGYMFSMLVSFTDTLWCLPYKQLAGGYISNAKRAGVKDPSQYWHLIYSWSAQSRDEAPFNKSIKCGELIFWMAESSGAVSKDRLNGLCDQILAGDVRDRRYWNDVIQSVCFDSIVETVTKAVA